MDINHLRKNISEGNIENVIGELLVFVDEFNTQWSTEVYSISSRYNALKREGIKGVIQANDYNQERNSIVHCILQIIDLIEDLDSSYFKKRQPEFHFISEIEKLASDFEKSKEIKSTPSRLRTKNYIAKTIGEKFIECSAITPQFINSTSEGIICGLASKVKIIPEIEGLEILEAISSNAKSNFSKGIIVNALAEIVYSGQLRLDDDNTILNLLDRVTDNADAPLQSNINRVKITLDYLTGKISKKIDPSI